MARARSSVSGGTLALAGNFSDDTTDAGTVLTNLMVASTSGSPAVLSISGSALLTYGNTITIADVGASGRGIMNISGGTLVQNAPGDRLRFGGGGAGVLNQSGGSVSATDWVTEIAESGGYGAMLVSGGTYNSSANGLWFGVQGNALVSQSGGSMAFSNVAWNNYQGAYSSNGVIDVSGGTFNGGSTTVLSSFVGTGSLGIVNVRGSGLFLATPFSMAGTANAYAQLNLSGGTLQAWNVLSSSPGLGTAVVNFNGGLLRATAGGTFMSGLNNVYVYPGGATLDTNGNTITINQSLTAAASYGLYGFSSGTLANAGGTLAVTNGGSGYIGPPIVLLSGGNGSGATAVATINGSGVVTGITITNPGSGYSSTDTLTATFSGGGYSTAAGSMSIPSADLASNAGGGFTKNGSGTLTFNGNPLNTYTGGTTINAGTLSLSSNNALPTGGNLYINAGGSLDFEASGGTIGLLSGGGTISRQGGGSTGILTVGQAAGSSTFSGVIQNGTLLMALTKIGSGTLTLSGTNTYTGGTIITAGTLQLGDGLTSNGSIVGTVSDNSVLAFANLLSQTFSAVISGTGAVAVNGPSPLILTAADNYSGPTTVSGGTLQLGNGTAGNDGSLATSGVTDNAVLRYNLSGSQTAGYSITGTGSLAKSGTGTLTLSGTDTYSNGTTVNAGTLQLAQAAAWPGTGTVSIGGAAVLAVNAGGTGEFTGGASGAGTIGGLLGLTSFATGAIFGIDTTNANSGPLYYSGAGLGGNAGLEKLGPNMLGLTAANTFGGAVIVAGGTLDLGGLSQAAPAVTLIQGVLQNGTLVNTSTSAPFNLQSGTVSATLASTFAPGLTMSGTGNTATLSGTNRFYGPVTVSGGTLALTGNFSENAANLASYGAGQVGLSVGSTSAVAPATLTISGSAQFTFGATGGYGYVGQYSNGILNVSGGTLVQNNADSLGYFMVGDQGNGVINQSGGSVSLNNWYTTLGWPNLGSGALLVSGGTFYARGLWVAPQASYSLVSQSGGSIALGGDALRVDCNGTPGSPAYGVIDVSGGTFATPQVLLGSSNSDAPGTVSILNVRGSGFFSVSTTNFNMGGKANANPQVNLAGGTLQVQQIAGLSTAGSGNSTTLNFNGGLLRAASGAATPFLYGMTNAYVYPGGAVIDSNGQAINISQPLVAADGLGVYPGGLNDGTLAYSGSNGGGGYLSPPIVTITGGSGSGATAVATLDPSSGSVTGITITNPGRGYSSTDTLTVNFLGGGPLTAAGSFTISAASSLQSNTASAGGLTKIGAGTLYLTGTSGSYSGATTVNAGTLGIGVDASLGNSNQINLNGSALHMGGGLTALSLTSVGSGYTSFPTIVGTATAGTVLNCGVTAITLSGTNYTAAPTLTISSPNLATGSMPTFSVAVSGGLATVTITNPGSGYIAAPTFTLGSTGTAVGAAVGTITYDVLGANLVGTGYDIVSTPTLSITGGGSGAILSVTQSATILAQSRSITLGGSGGSLDVVSGGTATVQGTIGGSGGLSKTSDGTLVLGGSNTYTGATNIDAGTLSLGNAGALPGGNITFGGGSLQFTAANTADYSGLIKNSTAAVTIDTNGQTVAFANSIDSSNTAGLSKLGAGALTLSANNSFSGNVNVGGGTLAISGGADDTTNGGAVASTLNIGSTSGLAAVLSISGGALLTVGNTGNSGFSYLGNSANGVLDISGGSLLDKSGNTRFQIGNGTGNGVVNQGGGYFYAADWYTELGIGGYGAYLMSGGTFFAGPNSGMWFGQSGNALLSQSGGSIGLAGDLRWDTYNAGSSANAVMDVSGGTFSGNGGVFIDSPDGNNGGVGPGSAGILNVRGSGLFSTTTISMAGTANAHPQLNLSGGTLQAQSITGQGTGAGTATVNFNGGTLRAYASGQTYNNFLQGMTNAYVYPGGLTVNSNGSTLTIAQNLTAADSFGLYAAASGGTLAVTNGGSGYIGPPVVLLSGGNGSGATAVATLSASGVVTGITITNPGRGYASTDTLTATFSGGGFTTAAGSLTIPAADLASNAGGGFVKAGSGMLTLSGTNSYAGGTTVGAGTLKLGNRLALGATTGGLTANGGTLDLAGYNLSVGPLAGAGGTITSSSTAAVTLTTSFETVASSFGGAITGPISLAKAGTGTLTLGGSNSYAGGTSIIGGRLVVGITNALPTATVLTLGDAVGASSGTLDLAGNSQTVAGLVAANTPLVANQVIGSSGASTVGTLTFAGGTNASTFGGTIEDGLTGGSGTTALAVASGTLTLTGSNIYSGGTSVTGGLLEITSASSLPAGTSLTIGAAAGMVFDAGIDSGTGATAGLPSSALALSTGKASGTLNGPDTAAPGGYPASSGTLLSAPLAVSPASGGSDVAAVPEPGTLALLAAGAGGALLAAWRRKRKFGG
jgi:autotransporter-associated beta strand protein